VDASLVIGAEVGRVAALWRYPVKSMAPEPVPDIEVSWHGLAGDRRWGFVRRGRPEASGFPWLTIRDRPDMVRYRPRLTDPDRPNASPVVVTTPSGAELDVTDPALAAELGAGLGAGLSAGPGDVRAVKLDRGTFDALPLSLITTQSVGRLGVLAGRPLDVRRFRPNLLVEAHGGEPFPEDAWTGCTLRIGDALVRLDSRDQRCVVVNIDPTTADRDPVVFRTVARNRRARLGLYGSTARPGPVAVGDPIVVAALPDPVPPWGMVSVSESRGGRS
jgi:uncharacterized protein